MAAAVIQTDFFADLIVDILPIIAPDLFPVAACAYP
jgi:hypothetical protein